MHQVRRESTAPETKCPELVLGWRNLSTPHGRRPSPAILTVMKSINAFGFQQITFRIALGIVAPPKLPEAMDFSSDLIFYFLITEVKITVNVYQS